MNGASSINCSHTIKAAWPRAEVGRRTISRAMSWSASNFSSLSLNLKHGELSIYNGEKN